MKLHTLLTKLQTAERQLQKHNAVLLGSYQTWHSVMAWAEIMEALGLVEAEMRKRREVC